MSICQGCGRILGRDCWNEADCIQISNQQAHDLYILEFVQRDLIYAEERIRYLINQKKRSIFEYNWHIGL